MALTFVTGGNINTVRICGALMGLQDTLVNLWVARSPISVISGVADAFKPACFVAIFCFLWLADRVYITIVNSTRTVVWLDTSGNSELVNEWNIHRVPICVTVFLHLGDDGLESMCPIAGSRIFSVVNQFALEYVIQNYE